MNSLYYVGLDVHKKSVSYCVKTAAGERIDRGKVAATRAALTAWADALPGPWAGALEATLFSGWIHDHLAPRAVELHVAHPAMLEAITRAKKKNDAADAEKLCDLLRTIRGVGEITALTWALEVGEPERFGAVGRAVSYCGLGACGTSQSAFRLQKPVLSCEVSDFT